MAIKDKDERIIKAMESLAPFPENIRTGNGCSWCGSSSISKEDFKDELSRKEFLISGFCQKCQDETFDEEYEEEMEGLSLDQPDPSPERDGVPAVWDLVISDMAERDRVGRERYGVPLQPHNGRDVLKDAYAEALDLAVYLRQAIYERDGK